MDVAVRRSIGFLLALAFVGCQNAPNASIELLESELRWMEDQLYAMDQQLGQASLQLASCQRNNDSLRSQVDQGDATTGSGDESAGTRRDSRPGSSRRPRQRSQPADRRDAPTNRSNDRPSQDASQPDFGVEIPDVDQLESELQVPDVDLGPGAVPEWLPEPASPQPTTDADSDLNEASFHGTNGQHQVVQVRLNPQLTGGYDFDGHPGDEGLFIVVEPQDASGASVRAAGPLTITVIDPKIPNRLRQLARWEFTAAETAAAFKKTLLGNGITLKLPWPNDPPRSTKLQVTVEFEPESGQRLVASRQVLIKRHGNMAHAPLAQPASSQTSTGTDPLLPLPPLDLGLLLPDHVVHQPAPPQFAPPQFGPPQFGPSQLGPSQLGTSPTSVAPATRGSHERSENIARRGPGKTLGTQRAGRGTPAAPTLRASRLTPIWQTTR